MGESIFIDSDGNGYIVTIFTIYGYLFVKNIRTRAMYGQ